MEIEEEEEEEVGTHDRFVSRRTLAACMSLSPFLRQKERMHACMHCFAFYFTLFFLYITFDHFRSPTHAHAHAHDHACFALYSPSVSVSVSVSLPSCPASPSVSLSSSSLDSTGVCLRERLGLLALAKPPDFKAFIWPAIESMSQPH